MKKEQPETLTGELPVIDNDQMALVEERLCASALKKLNHGGVPTKMEMEALERANARHNATSTDAVPPPPDFLEVQNAVTELGFEVTVAETLERRGIYDATRLKARKPELYSACVKMLGWSLSAEIIQQLLGLDYRTVTSVRDSAAAEGAITGYKEVTVKRLRAIVMLALDGLELKAANGELNAVEFGILVDKIELLSGGATSRVEVVENREDSEFQRFLLKSARKAQGMVLDARNDFQSAPALADGETATLTVRSAPHRPEAVPETPGSRPERVSRDIQSPDSAS